MNFFQRFFTKSPPVESAEQQTTPTIYAIARTIGDRFDEVAYPAEMLEDREFIAAPEKLAENYSHEELLAFSLSENAKIASLALLAFARKANDSAIAPILEHINSYERWPKFFALEALDRLLPAPQPLLGKLFVALNDDWSDGYDRVLIQFIRNFARRRVAAGEIATFDGALADASASRLDDVSALLERIDAEIAKPMREELKSHQAGRTNVSFLRRIGTILDKDDPSIIEHEALVAATELLVQTLTANARRSVLVVGDEGVGKTTAIRAAAKRLREAGWTIFEAGAPEVIAGQSYIGEIEERLQKMFRNLRAPRRVVWIVPQFHELLYSGAHRFKPTGILDMILPEIESGSIAVVGEISTAAHQTLLQQKPGIASAMVNVRVEPLSAEKTLELASELFHRPDVIVEAWQLATQYLGRRAAPGSLLSLLESTRARAGEDFTIDDLLNTLSRVTGLPREILDERQGLDLAAMRAHFESRVLGQNEAIDVLVERVALIKAGVTDPTRPLGVFLFAGPTGTGKTEIAKCLAEYLFGSSERMIRIDMSELQTADSVGRLVGGESASHSLVDEIRRQPFSIVLLDEMEKAHPRVLDYFLQVFDDGRLTDRRGNVADFRHAIVILTSNLGAAVRTFGRTGFSETNGPGFQSSTVMAALERELRKEFLNRLDRVVVFRPLSRETMRGILRKEIAGALQRRGLRNRDWSVEWDDSAIELLLTAGFTPDLGARPLKRAVERHFLTPLAEMIVAGRVPEGERRLLLRAGQRGLELDWND